MSYCVELDCVFHYDEGQEFQGHIIRGASTSKLLMMSIEKVKKFLRVKVVVLARRKRGLMSSALFISHPKVSLFSLLIQKLRANQGLLKAIHI